MMAKAKEKMIKAVEESAKTTKKTEKKVEAKAAAEKEVAAKVSEKKKNKYQEFVSKLRAGWNKKKKASKGWKVALNLAEYAMLSAWVWVCLMGAQYIVAGAILLLNNLGVSFAGASVTVAQTVLSAIIYMICLALTIALPWLLLGEKTTRDELGLRGLFTWTDIGLGCAGFVVSMIAILIVTAISAIIFPWIDMEQAQDVGFEDLNGFKDMLMAFITLVILAPVCEEIIFRGWLYGKLRARTWAIPAIILTSVMFGIAHGQWNVGITVGVMSVFMCLIREMTGTIWGGLIIHMLKNGLAYYLLFVRFV